TETLARVGTQRLRGAACTQPRPGQAFEERGHALGRPLHGEGTVCADVRVGRRARPYEDRGAHGVEDSPTASTPVSGRLGDLRDPAVKTHAGKLRARYRLRHAKYILMLHYPNA